MRWFALFSLFLITACAATVRSEVTSFSNSDALRSEQSFYIAPASNQENSIEFARYRDLLSSALIAQGYSPAAQKKSADIIASMTYGIDEEDVETLSPSIYGSVGVAGGSSSGVGVGVGLGTVIGSHRYGRDRYQDYAIFLRYLEVTMNKNGVPQNIFEGRATSEGSTRALPEVMPCLIKSLFDDFPNADGQPKKVSFKKEQCVF